MNNTTARDLFDELADDPFEDVSSTEDDAIEKIKNDLSSLLERIDLKDRKRQNGSLVNEVKNLVKAELARVKPVQNVIERQLEVRHEQTVRHVQVPVSIPVPPKPEPQIIREVRVEVEKKDPTKYAEEKSVAAIRKELDELKNRHQELLDALPFMHGGSGVIGIPNPEGKNGKTLQVAGNQAVWLTASGGGSVTPSGDTFVVSNLNKVFNYDATVTSIDELAAVLGALIASCRTSGIVL